MSTWCAAKSLFLYYRKYLSEHICNRLLWEHIRGNLVHTTHSGGFTFRQQTSRILQVASAHQSCHTPLQKTASAQLPSIFKIPTHTAVAFPTACLVLLKGSMTSFLHVSFPLLFPCGKQAKVRLFAKSWVCWMYLRRVLALLHHTLSFWEPLALPHPTWHSGWIWRALCYKRLPSSWNYSSRGNCNAMPRGNGNSWQIPSPAFRYNVSQCSSLILVTDKRKWQGNVGPHRKNLKSKTSTAEQNQSLLVPLLFSLQKCFNRLQFLYVQL